MMKLKNLETICIALAKSNEEEATKDLQELLEANTLVIKDNSIYEKIAIALTSSLTLMSEEEKRKQGLFPFEPRLNKESSEKVIFLGALLLPHIENVAVEIVKHLVTAKTNTVNALILNMANQENIKSRVREYLINHCNTFMDNWYLMKETIRFEEFTEENIEQVIATIDITKEKFKNKEIEEEELQNQVTVTLRAFMYIVEHKKNIFIDTELMKRIFSVPCKNGIDKELVGKLKEYEKENPKNVSINYVVLYDFLVKVKNYNVLEELMNDVPFYNEENISESLCNYFEQMEYFKDFIHHILKEFKQNRKWGALFYDLVHDITKNNVLAKGLPEDIIFICENCKDKEDTEETVKERIQKMIDNAKTFEHLPKNYYENFFFSLLLNKNNYEENLITLFMDSEIDIDFSYMPMHIYGPYPLSSWTAFYATKKALTNFLKQKDLPKVFYGVNSKVSLSSLYFKVGNIARGMHEFESLELMSEEEEIYLENFGCCEVSYEEGFNYKDLLTGLIDTILEMETEEEQKKHLIQSVLLAEKVKYVNLGIFEKISDLFSKEELRNLYELLQNRVFISYREDTDLGVDRVICIEIAGAEEIREVIETYIENDGLKQNRVQKNN